MALRGADDAVAVPVDGYGPGFFRVAGRVLTGPVIVAAGGARPWGGLGDAEPLLALAGSADLLFLGLGPDIARPPRTLTELLETAGLMIEALATPAAARSYNLTLTEGRRVACALLPV